MVTFATHAEALRFADAARAENPRGLTVEGIAQLYRERQEARGLKPATLENTDKFLASFLAALGGLAADELTTAEVQRWYDARRPKVAAATHHEELRMVKAVCAFAVKSKLLKENPAAPVESLGRANRGKKQLRAGEAQTFYRTALERAAAGDDTAMAAALALIFALRSSEITSLCARDVDRFEGGAYLWIDASKTDAGRRHLELPPDLVGALEPFTRGKTPLAPLFNVPPSIKGRRDWLQRAVHRICDAANVPRVCAHGLRGTHSTLAEDAGASARIVAESLGHTSHAVTAAHYLAPGTVQRVKARRALEVVGTSSQPMPVPAEISLAQKGA